MSWVIVLIVVFVYLFFILFLGSFAGRGRKKSIVEYVAASRSLGFITMYFLMGGAIFSAFAYLGGPGFAYSRGAAAYQLVLKLNLNFLFSFRHYLLLFNLFPHETGQGTKSSSKGGLFWFDFLVGSHLLRLLTK
ncbi:hypothetical protein ES705_26572 [subsurface metagenome]